jgi:hypothetical protein
MRKFFAVLFVGAVLSGCSALKMYQFDPMTVAQIEKTVTFENTDFALADKALEDLDAPAIVRTSLMIRHVSEIARLDAWLAAEKAKQLLDEGK